MLMRIPGPTVAMRIFHVVEHPGDRLRLELVARPDRERGVVPEPRAVDPHGAYRIRLA